MASKVWGGRFREDTDALVHRFNASIGVDQRLYTQDIAGSIAHCRMLGRQGILTEEEAARIVEALMEIRRELDRGELPFQEDFEDIHTLVEKALVNKLGPLGQKLHTARSRNDQVALDARLFIREAALEHQGGLRAVQAALVRLAEEYADCILPGYTHLQRAQPVLLAHHFLAYVEMLQRDWERYSDSLKRINVSPLGSAALAGSTFDLDRTMVAAELEFHSVSRNSMDAVSDRDFALEFLFNGAAVMMHLSRLSEELILWSTQEFGFISIADAFCTGSSIMPQKKNPDLPELIRGKTGRVYGNLMALLTTMKGLPLAYNKDMQEDKEAFFDTADTVKICLEVMSRLLGEITFDQARMRAAAERGCLTATDLADYLVTKGLPFREAHAVVGRMVLFALDEGRELPEMTLEQMKTFACQIEPDVYDWLDVQRSLERRALAGGTAPAAVRAQLTALKAELGL